jgi:GT2 family glycosyltransferase
MKDLSIIIISYNTKDLTLGCIRSIIDTVKKTSYEIIVVDNASTDQSVDAIEKLKLSSIKVFRNKKNLGFGKANNVGLKQAKGRCVLFLNSDTLVLENTLDSMVAWMDVNPDVGISSCALENTDKTLQGTGGYFPTLFRVFAWMTFIDDLPVIDNLIRPFHPTHPHSFMGKNLKFYEKEIELDWLTGAFMLVRREVVEKIGGFDEDYFMYTEDTDLCFRAKRAGWRVFYLPKWRIIHFGGASSTREFPLIMEYEGVKLFYKKTQADRLLSFFATFFEVGSAYKDFCFRNF